MRVGKEGDVRQDMAETEIAWQNKDVISKYFADHLKGKSLRAYGLDLPEIEAVGGNGI